MSTEKIDILPLDQEFPRGHARKAVTGYIGIHIDCFDFDPAAHPIPPAPIERTEDRCTHTPQPPGYMEWHAWAKAASKTHAQVRCPHCGLWSQWMPKREAKAINKRESAEDRRACDQIVAAWEARDRARGESHR